MARQLPPVYFTLFINGNSPDECLVMPPSLVASLTDATQLILKETLAAGLQLGLTQSVGHI